MANPKEAQARLFFIGKTVQEVSRHAEKGCRPRVDEFLFIEAELYVSQNGQDDKEALGAADAAVCKPCRLAWVCLESNRFRE
jgi:hypothetical protein